MKTFKAALAGFALILGGHSTAQAAEVLRTDDSNLSITGRLQMLGHMERVNDPVRDDNRAYMFMRQARLGANGEFEDVRFKLLLGFGGEDESKAPSPGVSLGLLDMYADVPIKFVNEHTYLRVGQFKVPYGLERLEDSGTLGFGDRSLQNVALRIGRDIGGAVHTRVGHFVGAAGLFAGGGRAVPERYLPMTLGVPLLVARVGIDNGLYENIFAEPSAAKEGGIKYAVTMNAAYTRDSKVGHSTVANVKLGEKSLLLNGNWNPYIGQAPMKGGEIWQFAADAAIRVPVGEGAVKAEAELSQGKFANAYGDLLVQSARGELGYERGPWEFAGRYAVVRPDARMAHGGVPFIGGKPFHEVTPAVAYNLPIAGTRVVVDAPLLLRVPVIQEPGIGSYLLTSQPDQATYIKTAKATVERMDVVTGRVMFQASF